MKKIKILYILPQAKQGGAETQLLNLLRRLDKNKFEPYLGMLYKNEQLEEEFNSIENVKVFSLYKKNRLDFFVYFKISSFIKENNIDIVQTFMGNHHAYIPYLLAGKCKCIGGIRATTKITDLSKKILQIYLPRAVLKIKPMVFVSNSLSGKDIYCSYGIPEKDVLFIPNGIDYARYSTGNREKIIKEFSLEKKIVLGIVSRLEKRKNHEAIFRILEELDKNIILLVVGDGSYSKELKKLAKKLNLESRIIFAGARKDIPDLLSAMDIFVFPTIFPEGWPNSVGEAMAAGLPVIAYPTGDIKYIIKDDYDGIVTKEDETDFKEKLISLIDDKKKRMMLGKNAKEKIKKEYTIEKMVASYERMYQDLTETR